MWKFLSDFMIIYSARIEKDLKTNPQGKNNKVNEQSTAPNWSRKSIFCEKKMY